jgi:hypothetical protein
MKIIKDKNVELDYQQIMNIVRLINDDNYILLETEEDITTYETIEYLYKVGAIDYKRRRRIFKYLIPQFNTLDIKTKDMICKFCLLDPNTTIGYYMGKGMTLNNAKYKYIYDRSIDIIEAAKCCEKYLGGSKFINVIITYLSIEEAERFLNDTQDLSYKYKTVGHFGISYGDKTIGLLDFISCSNGYETTGLSQYTINSGLILENFKTDLLDILYYGNYE